MYERHVDALLSAWNEGKLDGLDDYVAPDAKRRTAPSLNDDVDSLDGLKQVVQRFRTAFPDCHVALEEIHYQEGRSFAIWTFTGTNTGPGNFPATGKAVRVRGMSQGHYAGGKLIEEHVFFDALDMMNQLGIIPAFADAEG